MVYENWYMRKEMSIYHDCIIGTSIATRRTEMKVSQDRKRSHSGLVALDQMGSRY
jgi:hypothetical protein